MAQMYTALGSFHVAWQQLLLGSIARLICSVDVFLLLSCQDQVYYADVFRP